MNEQPIDIKIKKGILEYTVLTIISSGEMYASDILKALDQADLITVEGTLYPLLSKLTREGKVVYRWEESPSGPPRKYYMLSQFGFDFYKQYKESWDSTVKSIKFIEEKYAK